MIMKTLSLILFFLCISFSALHAQSLRDSISLEIVSFVDEENAGHYTSVRVKIENHTENFKYLLLSSDIFDPDREYWRMMLEVECQDKKKYELSWIPVFDLTERSGFLLPGEHLVETFPLFIKDSFCKQLRAEYNGSKVVRFRLCNGLIITRYKNSGEIELKDLYFYQPPEIATEWIDLTTPDFDFLRK